MKLFRIHPLYISSFSHAFFRGNLCIKVPDYPSLMLRLCHLYFLLLCVLYGVQSLPLYIYRFSNSIHKDVQHSSHIHFCIFAMLLIYITFPYTFSFYPSILSEIIPASRCTSDLRCRPLFIRGGLYRLILRIRATGFEP